MALQGVNAREFNHSPQDIVRRPWANPELRGKFTDAQWRGHSPDGARIPDSCLTATRLLTEMIIDDYFKLVGDIQTVVDHRDVHLLIEAKERCHLYERAACVIPETIAILKTSLLELDRQHEVA